MAAYGTLVAWAKAMGHDEAATILESILVQEKAADETLTDIAESGINQEAADAAHPEGEGDEPSTARRSGTSASSPDVRTKRASRR
jgi:hypothetical protein